MHEKEGFWFFNNFQSFSIIIFKMIISCIFVELGEAVIPSLSRNLRAKTKILRRFTPQDDKLDSVALFIKYVTSAIKLKNKELKL